MADEQLAETIERLTAVIEPVLEREGFELVDLVYRSGGKRHLLKVMVDRAGRTSYAPPTHEAGRNQPPTVGIDDCTRLSKTLSPVLDVEDLIPRAYTLEVSSPGLDRPLKTPTHFQRAVGLPVRVKTLVPIEGVSFFQAPVAEADDETVVLDARGGRVEIPYRLVESARLEVEL